jgi:hypothetical protein
MSNNVKDALFAALVGIVVGLALAWCYGLQEVL